MWNGLKFWHDSVMTNEDEDVVDGDFMNFTLRAVYISSDFNATEAGIAVRTLVNDSSVGAVTCYPSASRVCAQECALGEKIFFAMFGPDNMCSGPVDSFGNAFDYTFCIPVSSTAYSNSAFNQAKVSGYARTAIMYWETIGNLVIAGKEMVVTAEKEYGLHVLLNTSYATPLKDDGSWDEDLVDSLKEARDLGVESIFFRSSQESRYIVEIMKEINFSPSLLWMTVGPTNDDWLEWTGDFGDLVLTASQWHHTLTSDSDPLWGSSERYTAAYGVFPTYWNALGSLVGEVTMLAIDMGGSTDRESIVEGLRFINTVTFFGLVRFGQYNRNIGREPVTIQWQDEQAHVVLPFSIASKTIVLPFIPWDCREEKVKAECFETISTISRAASLTLQILSALIAAVMLAGIYGVHHYRKVKIFNHSSPLFCQLMLAFGILGMASAALLVSPASPVVCVSRVWTLGVAGVGVLANLLAKTYRIDK
ncbi:unnamed protein product [Discosporangium mesarthrocarpum]